MILSPSDYLRKILAPAVEYAARQLGLDVVGNTKAIIPTAYGTPSIPTPYPLQLPHEAVAGAKTHLALQIAGNRTAALRGGDPVAVAIDRNNNRWVVGKYVVAGTGTTDAECVMGERPVAPGNTLIPLDHDAEVSTTSATFVDVNLFHVDRRGQYRIKVELARSGGTAQARVVRKLNTGTVVVVTPTVSQATLTYPTFGAVQTMDMTIPVTWGDVLYVQLLNTSGPAQQSYMINCRLYYADATVSITPYDAAL